MAIDHMSAFRAQVRTAVEKRLRLMAKTTTNSDIFHTLSSVLLGEVTGMIYGFTATADDAKGAFEHCRDRWQYAFDMQVAAAPARNDSGLSLAQVQQISTDDESFVTLSFQEIGLRVAKTDYDQVKESMASKPLFALPDLAATLEGELTAALPHLGKGDRGTNDEFYRGLMEFSAIKERLRATQH